jgi:signal transduction histidine kinase
MRITPPPATMCAFAVVAELGAIALSWRLEPWTDTAIYAAYSATIAAAGLLVVSRHATNPVGWLLLWLGASNALGDLAQGYGLRAEARGWTAGPVGEWLNAGGVVLQMVPMFVLWLVFPTGRLLGRAWAGVVAAGGLGSVLAVGGYVFSHRSDGFFVRGVNPYVVAWLPTSVMWVIGNVILVTAMVGSCAGLVVRFLRSDSIERQQIKYVAIAGTLAAIVLPLGPFLWDDYPIVRAVVAIVLLAQPAAVCVAMFRYRLYDVDRVISRTISSGLVTAVTVAVYGVSVVSLGALVGRSTAWVTAGATLAAATAFGPARRHAQSLVDRRFDRSRFNALHRVTRFVDDVGNGRAAPEDVEALLRDVIGDPELRIHHRPHSDDLGGSRTTVATGTVIGVPVRRGTAVIATVTGTVAVHERRSLLADLLADAGLAIEIAGLRAELRHRLDDVEASRARLVAVADEERRRLERDLHDGAQQRLVSIGLALRHAQHRIFTDAGDASRILDAAVDEITRAIDELRELAHGLRPSSLDGGLGPALRELAQRAPLPVIIDATMQRYSPEAESTAYFVACEAATNAFKHAHASRVELRVSERAGALVVRVADDGVGGASPSGGTGLRGLADRLAALGGTLTISSCPTGTTITARIPCAS